MQSIPGEKLQRWNVRYVQGKLPFVVLSDGRGELLLSEGKVWAPATRAAWPSTAAELSQARVTPQLWETQQFQQYLQSENRQNHLMYVRVTVSHLWSLCLAAWRSTGSQDSLHPTSAWQLRTRRAAQSHCLLPPREGFSQAGHRALRQVGLFWGWDGTPGVCSFYPLLPGVEASRCMQ